jgi:hypothetical protein
MRRIDESIESLAPGGAPGAGGGTGATAPLAFRWRGRRYVVGTVLAHWVETGAWWRRTTPRPVSDELPDPERRLWRVEACRGAQTGVFDLCLEVDPLASAGPTGPAGPPGTERWSLHAIYD